MIIHIICLLQPPPAPRMRSKMDSLIFTSDSIKATRMEEPTTAKKSITPVQQSENQDVTKNIEENETELEVEVENVERPVDLYKVLYGELYPSLCFSVRYEQFAPCTLLALQLGIATIVLVFYSGHFREKKLL